MLYVSVVNALADEVPTDPKAVVKNVPTTPLKKAAPTKVKPAVAVKAAPLAPAPPSVPSPFWSWIRANTYLDLSGSVGSSSPTINRSYNNPTLLQWTMGATLAFRVLKFTDFLDLDIYLGMTSDYRNIDQYSLVESGIGNSRGTRFDPFAPTLVFIIEKILILKMNLQVMGNYNLSNPTVDFSTFSYEKPFGEQLTALFPLKVVFTPRWLSHLSIGAEVERVSYSQYEVKNITVAARTPALDIWQTGAVIAYGF